MSDLFIMVLNMSITAGYVSAAVILIRLLLRKFPKKFSYILWTVVLFRLICPISFNCSVSFLNLFNTQNNVVQDTVNLQQNTVFTNITSILTPNIDNQNSAGTIIQESSSAVAKISWINIISLIWIFGIVVLLMYTTFSYKRLKRRIKDAIRVRDNIYETDKIATPFVLGFIHPKIFIPTAISEEELKYVLLHEQIHIKRLDYLIKPLSFLLLIIHWYNPFIWLSYILMSKDMEMSCDEKVLTLADEVIKEKYSVSLLSLSVKQSGVLSPIAFGESNVKSRIKNILSFKKPAFWVSTAILIFIITVSVILISNANSIHQISNIQASSPIITLSTNVPVETLVPAETMSPIKVVDKQVQDIDGDGKPETIELQSNDGNNFTLKINNKTISGKGENIDNKIVIVDINKSDKYKEISVPESGPSADYFTSFYHYDSGGIIFMGKIGGEDEDIVMNGKSNVTGRTRGDILCTWWYKDNYHMTTDFVLKNIPPKDGLYSMDRCGVANVKMSIPIKLQNGIEVELKVGEKVTPVLTDNKEKVLLRKQDGTEGWIYINNFDRIKVGNTEYFVQDVFEGLNMSD